MSSYQRVFFSQAKTWITLELQRVDIFSNNPKHEFNQILSVLNVVLLQSYLLMATKKNLVKRCKVNTVKFTSWLPENRNVTHTRSKDAATLVTKENSENTDNCRDFW